MDNFNEEKYFRLALDITKNSYAPFSNFKVGAVLITKDGKVFTGVNVENSSYGLTICAERTAYVKAISEGEREFQKIIIASFSEEPASPCGACRQFMWEFGDIDVIMINHKGKKIEERLSDLLPYGFKINK